MYVYALEVAYMELCGYGRNLFINMYRALKMCKQIYILIKIDWLVSTFSKLSVNKQNYPEPQKIPNCTLSYA